MAPNKRLRGLGQALAFNRTQDLSDYEDIKLNIQRNLPDIPLIPFNAPVASLNDEGKILGTGGNSVVSSGHYLDPKEGPTSVAIKRTVIRSDDLVKLKTWYTVIKRLGFTSGESHDFQQVPYTLLPILLIIYDYPGQKFEFVEVYPICHNSNHFPINLNPLLLIFYNLACAFLEMHNRGVAHLDIKPDNILWKRETDRHSHLEYSPQISDLGSAILFDSQAHKKAQISTTITLILQNPYIHYLCRPDKKYILEQTNIDPDALFHLISNEIPQSHVWIVDNLLFGILLLDPWHSGMAEIEGEMKAAQVPLRSAAFLPPIYSGRHTVVEKESLDPMNVQKRVLNQKFNSIYGEMTSLQACGQHLVVNSLRKLFPIWGKNPDDYLQPNHLPLPPLHYSMENLNNFCTVLEFYLREKFPHLFNH